MFQRPRVLPLLRNKEGNFSRQNREGKKSVTSSVPGQSNLSRDENLMKVDHPIIKHVQDTRGILIDLLCLNIHKIYPFTILNEHLKGLKDIRNIGRPSPPSISRAL